MEKKLFLIVCAGFFSTVGQLNAAASETSEERQRDTFTLYDRNRRELNWQRQHPNTSNSSHYRRPSGSSKKQVQQVPVDRRGRVRGSNNPATYGGYAPMPYESDQIPYRGYDQPSYGYQTDYSVHQQYNYPRRNQDYFPIPAVPPVD